jgi:uncharacterized integral membrane protein
VAYLFLVRRNIVTVVLVIVGFALAGVLISAFYFLDRLIRHEYQFHREAWEHDGRPVGYLFRPPGATSFRSGLAFHLCGLGWPLLTPRWVREDLAAKRLLSRLRWCVLIWNVGFIVFFVFAVRHFSST